MSLPAPRYGFPMQSSYTGGTRDLHGSARWLLPEEARAAGMFNPGGVVLGQTENGKMLSFHGDGHLLAFAPSGAGKGIGFVQPNLILYPGSMIVLDPKGENAAVSARHRRQHWQQRVVVLDPFGVSGQPTDSYNPLAPLSDLPADALVGELRTLTEALIPSRGGRDEAHWINGARQFIEGLVLFLLFAQGAADRHLVRLHTLAFGTETHLFNVFTTLQNLVTMPVQGGAIDADLCRIAKAYGNWWFGREPKERSYFLSIVHQELAWLGDTVWPKVLMGGANVSPKEEPTTVYLVLPWQRLRGYRNWLRIMVASLLSSVIAVPGHIDHPVLFLLDEAYLGLGRLDMVLEAAAILRGEGGKIALVYQDLNQLKSLYPEEWESFLDNAGASLFWSINGMTGGEYVSRRCGMETRNVPGSPSGQGRQLRQASELLTLPEDEIICFLRNLHPARFGRIDVRKDARLNRFLDPNPKHARVQPRKRGLPGSQPARGFVAVDLDAPIPKAARGAAGGSVYGGDVEEAPVGAEAADYDYGEAEGVILNADGTPWRGGEKPLPPPPALSQNVMQTFQLGAKLSEQFGRYVVWSEQQQGFGYLDEMGFWVGVG